MEDWLELRYSAVLTLEHAADHPLPAGGRTRTFGDSALTVYSA